MDVSVLAMCISAVASIGPVLIVFESLRNHVPFTLVRVVSASASSVQIEEHGVFTALIITFGDPHRVLVMTLWQYFASIIVLFARRIVIA